MTETHLDPPGLDFRGGLYDRLASSYASDRNEIFYHKIARLLGTQWTRLTTGKALDVGCGMGFSTEVFTDLAPRAQWFGLDPSEELLRRARDRLSDSPIQFVHGRAESPPFFSGTFEWITSSLSFHWFGPEAERSLFRILAPGGRLSLAVPLLSPGIRDSGNALLRRWVLQNRQSVSRRPTQGFTWQDLRDHFPEWKILSAEETLIRESFPDSDDFIEVLKARGAWEAIFGKEISVDRVEGPLSFCWKIGVIHLVRPGLAGVDSTGEIG